MHFLLSDVLAELGTRRFKSNDDIDTDILQKVTTVPITKSYGVTVNDTKKTTALQCSGAFVTRYFPTLFISTSYSV